MNRLAIFADARDVATRVLLPRLLESLEGRPNFACVAVLTPRSAVMRRPALSQGWNRLLRAGQMTLGSGRMEKALGLGPISLPRLARRHGFTCRPLPGDDPNHPDVLHWLRREWDANLALCIYPKRLFGTELLNCFEMAVNYHNGTLPRFRGWRTSNWSLYLSPPASGYTFHRMDAGLDTGNILISGEVALEATDTPADLELRKASAARDRIPALLSALEARASGHRQHGIACLHCSLAYGLATRVDAPESLTYQEWNRRLHAFLRIHTRINGHQWPVTGLAPTQGPGRLTFRTSDGAWLRVTGINFWPFWAYSI